MRMGIHTRRGRVSAWLDILSRLASQRVCVCVCVWCVWVCERVCVCVCVCRVYVWVGGWVGVRAFHYAENSEPQRTSVASFDVQIGRF